MSADDNDMWLAVAARLLPNLDILTAHPTRQSLASLIGLSINEAGLRLVPCAKPGKLTHVYMIANFKDGGHYFQVMNADEIEAAAKRSPSYGKAVSPWKSDYEAMAKKTVIRRAFPLPAGQRGGPRRGRKRRPDPGLFRRVPATAHRDC